MLESSGAALRLCSQKIRGFQHEWRWEGNSVVLQPNMKRRRSQYRSSYITRIWTVRLISIWFLYPNAFLENEKESPGWLGITWKRHHTTGSRPRQASTAWTTLMFLLPTTLAIRGTGEKKKKGTHPNRFCLTRVRGYNEFLIYFSSSSYCHFFCIFVRLVGRSNRSFSNLRWGNVRVSS